MNKSNNGFTLIETVVVMGITAILATIVIVQLTVGDPADELTHSKIAMQNVLQLARSYAINGYNKTSGDLYGVGVYMDMEGELVFNTDYSISLDLDGNNKYYVSGSEQFDQLIDDYVLEDDVYVSATSSSFGADNFNLMFGLYDGTVYDNGYTFEEIYSITLKHVDDDSLSQTVSINGITGKIE